MALLQGKKGEPIVAKPDTLAFGLQRYEWNVEGGANRWRMEETKFSVAPREELSKPEDPISLTSGDEASNMDV